MGNIPTQATGKHDLTRGDEDEFRNLATLLRDHLALVGGSAAQKAQTHQAHSGHLMRITALMTMRPEGYEQQVLALAEPILSSPGARIDVLARVSLAVGRIHLESSAQTVETQYQAYVVLHQAWMNATALTGPLYDLLLVVEAGTQLALAMHRLKKVAEAGKMLRVVRSTIDTFIFTDESPKEGVEKAYAEMAVRLNLQ